MMGRAVWTAVALGVVACAATTRCEYPEDLGSDNYVKRTLAAQEFARTRDAEHAALAFPLLNDEHITLRMIVHQALRDLSDGEDFGYQPDLSAADRARLAKRWAHWWERTHG
ncbi:MAG: hypothetical protein ACYTHK_12040 [Planctomycetota bacterium]|jgi:hypothetical protein